MGQMRGGVFVGGMARRGGNELYDGCMGCECV